jgi:phosphatidylglycerophosphate synthase
VIDKFLREPKEQVLAPLAQSLAHRVHPNTVTVIAAGVGIACAVAAATGQLPLAIGLWVVNRLLDGIDGTLARLSHTQSDLGGYLDIVLDHVVYAAIPLGLALAAGTTAALIALAVLLAVFYVNASSWMYLAALLEKRNRGAAAGGELTTVTMPSGLIEGTETIVFYSLFLLFPGWIVPLFWLMAGLTLFTVGQRIVWAVRHLR